MQIALLSNSCFCLSNVFLGKVRQAVVEAKEELQQSQSTSGGSAGRHNSDDDIGVSGFVSLVSKL